MERCLYLWFLRSSKLLQEFWHVSLSLYKLQQVVFKACPQWRPSLFRRSHICLKKYVRARMESERGVPEDKGLGCQVQLVPIWLGEKAIWFLNWLLEAEVSETAV